MTVAPDAREDDDAPATWTRWGRFRGTLDELLAGTDELVLFERSAPRSSDDRPVRVMRGNQDYPTLHVGRGTKWAKSPRRTK